MTEHNSSRRDFLKTGTAGSAGLSLPWFVPRRAWGRAGSTAPSNRTTLAFIGLGNRAFRWANPQLLPSFVGLPNCHVLAVCDVDRTRIGPPKALVDETYGNKDCDTYGDFREILLRKDIDAVVIATPHHWHAVMTIMACQHGKDVYCEKPLCQTVREARAMAEAARTYARVVQAGTQGRSSPVIGYACNLIRTGGLGKLKQVLVGCSGQARYVRVPPEPVPDYLDWDMYVGPAPWCPYSRRAHSWSSNRAFSGGTITDWGHHFFDVAQWALGVDHSGPVEIFPADGKEHEYLTFRYANGAEIALHTKGGKALSTGTTFVGTEGKIWIQAWTDEVRFEPEDLGRRYYRELQAMRSLSDEQLQQAAQRTGTLSRQLHNNHLENFLDCVRTRRRPNADVAMSRHTIMVPHLTNIALWTNRHLRWDPNREQFVGDSDANRYLDIPPRQPWKL